MREIIFEMDIVSIIKLIPDKKSQEEIQKYLKINIEFLKFPKNKFHSTIYYNPTKKLIKEEEVVSLINSVLPEICEIESLDVFDENSLVLRYQSEKIENLSKEIYAIQNSKHSYQNFNPHLTIAKKFENDLKRVSKFEDKILFDGFLIEYLKR